ncbi:MAG: hypothetical protein IT380_28485 [Myxococcales bacterium]|nr:hypothetical protein [Myxococcales bacterium]
MWRYLQDHEAFIKKALTEEHDRAYWEGLAGFHEKQVRFMQHERLIHLLVTLTVAVLALGSVVFVAVRPILAGFALAALLLALVSAYLVHYFRLENGVQRWYFLANRIDEKRGVVHARYEQR